MTRPARIRTEVVHTEDVADHGCVDQAEAARLLGIARFRAATALAMDHLDLCRQCSRRRVTRRSVEAELHWRETASLPQRLKRAAATVVDNLSF